LLSSRGSFQKLLSLNDPLDVRQESVECLKLLLEKPDDFILSSWRDQIKDRAVASQYLQWWMLFLRDAAILISFNSAETSVQTVEQIFSQDQMPLIELLKKYSQQKIQNLFLLLLKSENALWSYQDPVLLFEKIFLSGFYHLGEEVYVD
jgi:hypothetical protein